MISYSMKGKGVLISTDFGKSIVLDEKQLRNAIKAVEMSKANYATVDEWKTQLAIYTGALSFLLMNRGV